METKRAAPIWKKTVAFGIIYVVWGSTFLAIRVGVGEVPPFLFAAMRFLTAGLVLFGWTRMRGERGPTRREWKSVLALAALIFVGDYGLLFWAERRVASGIAAVMMATIPGFTALAEIVLLGTQRLTARLVGALVVGFGGVAVLLSHTVALGGAAIDGAGAGAMIVGAVCWSVASVLSRRMPLPGSKVVSSATQMMAGGLMLTVAAVGLGEMRVFDVGTVSGRAWFALAYLIVAGSIVGFTAYVWLLQHESPTRVGTYAYVNPVVAVLLGWAVGGEAVGVRTVVGMGLVLLSVVLLTTASGRAGAGRKQDQAAEVPVTAE